MRTELVLVEPVIGGQIQSTEFLKYNSLNTSVCFSEPVVAGREVEEVCGDFQLH